jgi:hypothetical protein
MIVSLAWKEYREHRIVWVFMALVAVVLIVLVTQVYPALNIGSRPGDTAMYLLVAAVGSVLTYGVVCGAMLLAGEREGSTLAFLDALTGRRLPIWFAKLVPGVGFCLMMGLFVGGVAAAASSDRAIMSGFDGPPIPNWLLVAALPVIALDAFVWGLLASALCSSVLTAAGLAALFWLLGWLLLLPCGAFEIPMLPVLGRVGLDILMLCLSALAYCQTETNEREAPTLAPLRRVRVARSPGMWRVLVWLPIRQGWVMVLVLMMLALLFGLFLPVAGAMMWLSFTLVVGVLCGIAAFGGEQAEGSSRFLGNQRFPLGRVWAAKIGFWFLAALLISVVFLLAGVFAQFAFRSAREGREPFLLGSFLTRENWPLFIPLGLLYGFTIGQFYSLLWRKSIVAVVMALIVSPGFALLWLPSLVFGGLHVWQVFVPPLVLLAATRFVIWAWCSTGIAVRRPALTLAGCAVASLVWIATTLCYRYLEVPNIPQSFDPIAYEKSLLVTDDSGESGGPRMRTAGDKFRTHFLSLPFRPGHPAALGLPAPRGPETCSLYAERLDRLMGEGWPEQDQELDQWLEGVFAAPQDNEKSWERLYREAAAMALGVMEDPMTTPLNSPLASTRRALEAGTFLEARALQLQLRQQHAQALDMLFLMLDLSRQMRNHALTPAYSMGQHMEAKALQGLDRWLPQCQSPVLLRRALSKLIAHEERIPSARLSVQAAFIGMRQKLDAGELYQAPAQADSYGGPTAESEIIATLWFAPWERARHHRLLNALTEAGLRAADCDPREAAALTDRAERPSENIWEYDAKTRGLTLLDGALTSTSAARWGRLLEGNKLAYEFHAVNLQQRVLDAFEQCRLRAAQLKVALRLYQEEHNGQPAPNLEALVAHETRNALAWWMMFFATPHLSSLANQRFLVGVPLDPFDGQPFRYRVSDGKDVDWRKAADHHKADAGVRKPAVLGVVWSVGPDGIDHGGRKHGEWNSLHQASQWKAQGLDYIFVVPGRDAQ